MTLISSCVKSAKNKKYFALRIVISFYILNMWFMINLPTSFSHIKHWGDWRWCKLPNINSHNNFPSHDVPKALRFSLFWWFCRIITKHNSSQLQTVWARYVLNTLKEYFRRFCLFSGIFQRVCYAHFSCYLSWMKLSSQKIGLLNTSLTLSTDEFTARRRSADGT